MVEGSLNFMKSKADLFTFKPAALVPFRDLKAIERVRRIRKRDIAKHRNPDFRVTVVPDAEFESKWISDMFFRVREAMEARRPLVMIMPNPWPGYAKLAALINKSKINCLCTFIPSAADEYARK